MYDPKVFINYLNQIRIKRGLLIKDVCESAGISEAAWSNMKSTKDTQLFLADRLCYALDCTYEIGSKKNVKKYESISFVDFIKLLEENTGCSAHEIAKKCKMDMRVLRCWMQEKNGPMMSTTDKLCNVFNVKYVIGYGKNP